MQSNLWPLLNSPSWSIIDTVIVGKKSAGDVVPGFSVSVMLNVSLISCETPSTLSVKKTGTNGELASGRMRLFDTVTSLLTSAQHKHAVHTQAMPVVNNYVIVSLLE